MMTATDPPPEAKLVEAIITDMSNEPEQQRDREMNIKGQSIQYNFTCILSLVSLNDAPKLNIHNN